MASSYTVNFYSSNAISPSNLLLSSNITSLVPIGSSISTSLTVPLSNNTIYYISVTPYYQGAASITEKSAFIGPYTLIPTVSASYTPGSSNIIATWNSVTGASSYNVALYNSNSVIINSNLSNVGFSFSFTGPFVDAMTYYATVQGYSNTTQVGTLGTSPLTSPFYTAPGPQIVFTTLSNSILTFDTVGVLRPVLSNINGTLVGTFTRGIPVTLYTCQLLSNSINTGLVPTGPLLSNTSSDTFTFTGLSNNVWYNVNIIPYNNTSPGPTIQGTVTQFQ